MNHLEDEFGDSISATPPSSGAGLIAWILPALAVIVGGAAVTYVVVTWSKNRELPTAPRHLDRRSARLLDAEIKKLEPENMIEALVVVAAALPTLVLVVGPLERGPAGHGR